MSTPSAPVPGTQDSSSDPVLDVVLRLIAHNGVKVPPIPTVVAKLSEQLANPNFELRQIAQTVGTDQALAAHILRCASSSLLGGRGEVTSLQDAVMRVGGNGLFSLAVSFAVGRETARSSPLQSVRRDVFRKAATVAEFCRRLAPRFATDPDRAFLCGLLANFGLTVALGAIDQAVVARQVTEIRAAEAWLDTARRCEERIASSVASEWGMPKLVSEVIAARREGTTEPRLLALVRLLGVAEGLTELFYRDAAPAVKDIAGVVGCSVDEAGDIAHFLPEVAASVLALGSAADDLKLTQSIPIAVVEAPPTTLKGRVVTTNMPVTVERKSGDQQLMCVGLASDGMVAHGTQPLPLNQVVKCRLIGVDEDLELVAFVSAVLKEDDYRFEIKPMGLTGINARKWQELRGDKEGESAATTPRAQGAAPRGKTSVIQVEGLPDSSPRQPNTSVHSERFTLRRLGSWLRGGGS